MELNVPDNKKLTASLEDYLEAIAELCEAEGHAHTKSIAAKLNVKAPSVTGALRQLTAMGYITYNTHYPVQLTQTGRDAAAWVAFRHKVLKQFLLEVLKLNTLKASETACLLEHSVDREIIDRFELLSAALTARKDAEPLRKYLAEAIGLAETMPHLKCCTLSELPARSDAELVKISENADRQMCKKLNLAENMPLYLKEITPDKNLFMISSGSQDISIPAELAENLWVTPVKK